MDDFQREIDRMESWYQPGRKKQRRRLFGIVRDEDGLEHLAGIKSVWSRKVRLHYQRLRKPLRLQGLWQWRNMALALHAVPVEPRVCDHRRRLPAPLPAALCPLRVRGRAAAAMSAQG